MSGGEDKEERRERTSLFPSANTSSITSSSRPSRSNWRYILKSCKAERASWIHADLESWSASSESSRQARRDANRQETNLYRVVLPELDVILEEEPREEAERHFPLSCRAVIKVDRVEDLFWRDEDVCARRQKGRRG